MLKLHEKHHRIYLLLAILFCPAILFSQEDKPVLPSVKLSGFVKNDFFYDTRQTVSAREGHFLLFPSPHAFDENGEDINASGSINMLAVQSNLGASFTAPKALGAAISGLVEGDFFGGANATVNMIRLRHAYVKLNWDKVELLAGQYWHPVAGTPCIPSTISYNTGAPIHPISRTPQIRLTYSLNTFKVFGALLTQRDNASPGPDGTSSKYLRNSGLPEIQLGTELNSKKAPEFILGAGFGYKRLRPRLVTGQNYKTTETVPGITANAYVKYVNKKVTVKLATLYLENGGEFLNLSGYAVKDTLDTVKGLVDYAPVRTICYWSDINTNGKLFQVGIFAGYTQNLGTKDVIHGPIYLMSDAPIKSLYRISPRFSVKQGSFTIASEIEYTAALYGTPDNHCIMVDTYRVDNTRFLLSVMYRF